MPPVPDRRPPTILGLNASDWSIVAMVLIVKAAVLAFGALSFEITNDEPLGSLAHWLSLWNRWDAPQYVLIAEHGYGAAGDARLALVFFPLYPMLIRALASVVHDAVLCALLISTVASVATGVVLGRLFALDYPPRLARRAVWFLFIFPTSYFLHVGYSESLFIALVAGAFLAARRARWVEAGGLGALAAMARPNGILLMPALGVEALAELWGTRRLEWRWLWTGAVVFGLGVHMLVNYRVTGDPLAFLHLEYAHWSNRMIAPWQGVAVNLGVAHTYNPHDAAMIGTQILFYLAVGLAGTIAAAALLRPSYAAWMGLNWLVFASQAWDISAPRYLLVMFPLFILIAILARNRHWHTAITVWSLLWLGMFTSEFVRGHWAF